MTINKTTVTKASAGLAVAIACTAGTQTTFNKVQNLTPDTYRVASPSIERVSWHVPDDWTDEDEVIVYKQEVDYSGINTVTQFDPNQVIQTDDSGLTNYASALPIQSSWTNVSDVYTEKPAPVLDVDAKTYMKFQTFGYNEWNKQSHLARGSYAYTGAYNIRMVDGRMLIALGTNYCSTIGTYIDVQLQNGTVLPCILGDIKSDLHTDETHSYQKWDHSVLEFIVDSPGHGRDDYSVIKSIPEMKGGGSYSVIDGLNSPVVNIRVYNKVFPIDMSDISNDNPDY